MLARLTRIGEVRGHDLDGDITIEACIVGLIDLGHAPGAEDFHDLVRTEVGTGGNGHGRSLRGETVNGS
jgi:hypothetical protein